MRGDRRPDVHNPCHMNLLSDSAVYALKRFQKQMKGEAKKAGFISEDDIAEWITKARREDNAQ
jgi:hypothetical protein